MDTVLTGFSWDSLIAFALIVGAAFFVARRIMRLKRPACDGACPGCHGARQGRGCAMAEKDLNSLIRKR